MSELLERLNTREEWAAYFAEQKRRKAALPYKHLSKRVRNSLWNAGLETREAVASVSEEEMMRWPNFGRKQFWEIKAWLAGAAPDLVPVEMEKQRLLHSLERAREKLAQAQARVATLENDLAQVLSASPSSPEQAQASSD